MTELVLDHRRLTDGGTHAKDQRRAWAMPVKPLVVRLDSLTGAQQRLIRALCEAAGTWPR